MMAASQRARCLPARLARHRVDARCFRRVRGRSHPHRRAEDRHVRLGASDRLRARPRSQGRHRYLETTELASTEAGKIALEGGSVDLMLSDWLWVARERALGDDVVFYPYSSALGAVMVPPIRRSGELPNSRAESSPLQVGRSIKAGCCSGRLARRSKVDLKTQADMSYGAPPLLSAKSPAGQD